MKKPLVQPPLALCATGSARDKSETDSQWGSARAWIYGASGASGAWSASTATDACALAPFDGDARLFPLCLVSGFLEGGGCLPVGGDPRLLRESLDGDSRKQDNDTKRNKMRQMLLQRGCLCRAGKSPARSMSLDSAPRPASKGAGHHAGERGRDRAVAARGEQQRHCQEWPRDPLQCLCTPAAESSSPCAFWNSSTSNGVISKCPPKDLPAHKGPSLMRALTLGWLTSNFFAACSADRGWCFMRQRTELKPGNTVCSMP